MRADPLEQLVAAARALPGERHPAPSVASSSPASTAAAGPVGPPASGGPQGRGGPGAAADGARAGVVTGVVAGAVEGAAEVPALRRAMGQLLGQLAARLEDALPAALERATRAWDQVDTLAIVDDALGAEARRVERWAQAHVGSPEPSVRAAGVEAERTLAAALGVITLLERRMATLVRLRLRGPEPELLPGGRPFLDVSAALRETARAWR